MNHKGAPFYGSILESRQLCLFLGASILFVIAGFAETFPTINSILELRQWLSRRAKLTILALCAIDVMACSASKRICAIMWDNHVIGAGDDVGAKSPDKKSQILTAANEEE